MHNQNKPAAILLRLFSALSISLAGMAAPAVAADTPELVLAPNVNISRDAADMPGPLAKGASRHHKLEITSKEITARIDEGAAYEYWTFDGKVPGPFLRMRVGDTADLTLTNDKDSKFMHSIDLHAVTGPGGGAGATQVIPGESKRFFFKAIVPGIFVYHCATPNIPHHISNGMYGLILVEPAKGLPKVDRELYVMQGDIYTHEKRGAKGVLTFDEDKLDEEEASFVVFNGAADALIKNPLKAKVGETVRIWFGVGGPNLTSSFHVIGEMFDRVYREGSLTSKPLADVQTTSVAPGGATMVEFKLQVPGTYILVDHALFRLAKGGAGLLVVEGDAVPSVFKVVPGAADH